MAWPIGFSWTETHWEITTNPDKSTEPMRVQGGPFYFNPRIFGLVYLYAGMRPTGTWGAGWGDEGWLTPLARLMKGWGIGNFGLALRRAK